VEVCFFIVKVRVFFVKFREDLNNFLEVVNNKRGLDGDLQMRDEFE
jgi:hypothetical protein